MSWSPTDLVNDADLEACVGRRLLSEPEACPCELDAERGRCLGSEVDMGTPGFE